MSFIASVWSSILFTSVLNYAVPAVVSNTDDKPILNVAVIGSGITGLLSAKYSLDYGYNVTIYEQTEQIGGIWFYTNKTNKDKYGINIHTAMYQGLRANTPHQLMEMSGFSFPKNVTSYPPQAEVLSYLHSYVDNFDLKKHIKFSHQVIRVLPIEDGKWEIIVKNLLSNTFETNIYDPVFVCNGHYSKPFYPNIPGSNDFKGKMIHSHDFRTAEAYRNISVLVIGGGISGIDIVEHLLKTASRITFSRQKRPNETQAERLHVYSEKVTLQDDVVSFTSTGARFIDGSHQTFDAVIFATGYNYSYSFLSADAGIHIKNKSVQPLYRRIFNINHPSMVFIGILRKFIIPMYDLQVRYALKFISGAKKLPSQSEMLEDLHRHSKNCNEKDDIEDCNQIGRVNVAEYIEILAQEAEIEKMLPVLRAINIDSVKTFLTKPLELRKYKYIIIDDETFEKVKCDTNC